MKGYLNGGVFKESFIQEWQKNPRKLEVNEALLQELINFKSYSETHLGQDQNYVSVREILKNLELSEWDKLEKALEENIHELVDSYYKKENPIFNDYTKFTNSFRIIAKQKGIHKAEGLFVMDADFDVSYTVEPNPDYKQALEEHYKLYGTYPKAYSNLIAVYEIVKKQIHDHMTKLPFCRKYFAMLGVINFFSYYFMTLKKHQKVPILPKVDLRQAAKCPALFPPLPILNTRQEHLKISKYDWFATLLKKHRPFLEKIIKNQATQPEIELVQKAIELLFWDEVHRHASADLKRHLSSNPEKCQKLYKKYLGITIS